MDVVSAVPPTSDANLYRMYMAKKAYREIIRYFTLLYRTSERAKCTYRPVLQHRTVLYRTVLHSVGSKAFQMTKNIVSWQKKLTAANSITTSDFCGIGDSAVRRTNLRLGFQLSRWFPKKSDNRVIGIIQNLSHLKTTKENIQP